ncbi:MAG: AAA family ATPase, partial [Planctomycetota bacterium]
DQRFGSCTAALGMSSGVDVRGVGGYVVLPADGNGRAWLGDDPRDGCELREPPSRIVEFLPPAGRGAARKGRGSMAPAGTASEQRFLEVTRALRTLDPSIPRAGWLRVIFAVHAALDADERGAELVEQWSACTTIAGQYVPGEPSGTYSVAVLPWKAKKGTPPLVDAETLFFMAKQAGHKAEPSPAPLPAITIASSVPGSLATKLAQELNPGPDGKFANGSTWDPDAPPPKVDPAKKAASSIVLTDWQDLLSAPPVEYLIEGWIPEAATVVFAGAPTAGKSLQVIDWMMRLAHGMPWRGNALQPCSCLYLCGEGHRGIAARLRAWSLQHSPEPSDRYVMVSNRIPAIAEEGQGERILAAMLEQLAEAKGHAPGLVIVDTLSQAMAGGDENGSDVVPLLNNLAAIRDQFGCTAMAVHHLRKQGAPRDGVRERLTLDAVRGSGAIVGNVDTVLGAERLTGPDVEVSVLKQKDGAAGIRSLGSITVVETNVARRNGRLERSAIVIAAPIQQEQSEEARLAIAAEAMARAVTEALQAMGGRTTSRDAIYARVNGKTDRKRAGVAEAIARGWLRPCQPSDRGLEVTDAGLAVCSTHTHTRPLKGAGGAECAPADAGASAPDQGADEGRNGAAGRTRPDRPGRHGTAGTADEGQPEQPKRRRSRKAGGAA